MLINPKVAIKEGWVKYPDWMSEEFRDKCLQPNALDISIDDIKLIGNNDAYLSEDNKQMRKLFDVEQDDRGFWILEPGLAYDFTSDFYATIPEGVASKLIIRSTLNRCNLMVSAGLYDTGFFGHIAGVIRNLSYPGIAPHNRGRFFLAPHTRICQMEFYTSDNNGHYSGGYSHSQNTHWTSGQDSLA